MNKNKGVSEIEKLRKDLLWSQYQEFRNHARHSETLRSNVNNYLGASTAGVVTVITLGGLNKSDLILSVLLILLGVIGVLFSASYIELYQKNRARASELINELDRLFFRDIDSRMLNKIKTDADIKHYSHTINSLIRKYTNTHWFWTTFPAVAIVVGVVLTFVILFSLSSNSLLLHSVAPS